MNTEILYVDEDMDQELLDQAWDLAKNSGINILSDKDLKFIAVVDGIAAGAVFDSITDDKYSFDTIVHPDYQRLGIGKKLIDEAISEKYNLEEAFPELEFELDVVNPNIKRYLESLGFIPENERMYKMGYLEKAIKLIAEKDVVTLSQLKEEVSRALSMYGDVPVSGPNIDNPEYGSVIEGFEENDFTNEWDGSKYVPITGSGAVVELMADAQYDVDDAASEAITISEFSKMVDQAISSFGGDTPVVGPTYGADYARSVLGIELLKENSNVTVVKISGTNQFSMFAD